MKYPTLAAPEFPARVVVPGRASIPVHACRRTGGRCDHRSTASTIFSAASIWFRCAGGSVAVRGPQKRRFLYISRAPSVPYL